MKKIQFGVIDYGLGNVGSVVSFLKRLNFYALVSRNPKELEKVDILILPGVGAFQPALTSLKEAGLDKFIPQCAKSARPIIGICLGMQLLGRSSRENGFYKGLNIFNVDVLPLRSQGWHIGWNSVKPIGKSALSAALVDKDFYFNHAYCFQEDNPSTVGETRLDGYSFPSIMKNKNVIGLQFHPEKSQQAGLDFFQHLVASIT